MDTLEAAYKQVTADYRKAMGLDRHTCNRCHKSAPLIDGWIMRYGSTYCHPCWHEIVDEARADLADQYTYGRDEE